MLKTVIAARAIRIATEGWVVKRTVDTLHYLDDRMLKDIGLSRADALAEAARAPWDLGPPRRC